MGFIDPMVIGNAVTTGVLEFSIGPVLGALTTGLLGVAAAGILLSVRGVTRVPRLTAPPLPPLRLVAVGPGRAA